MKKGFAGLLVALIACPFSNGEDWSRFRGPNGTGVVANATIPLEWSSTKNLKWKTKLPGSGVSSPIVTGNRIYLTCYTGYGMDQKNPGNEKDLVRHLLAFERSTGKEIWRKSVPASEGELPYKGFITQHGYASSTPVSDGNHVYVLFGKSGLYCYDRDGNQVWQADLGKKSDPAKWGDGTSPILYKDLVVVNAGILGNQFVAYNKSNGQKAWSVEDSGFTNCWSTPTVASTDRGDQILFHVPKRVVAIDPTSGEKLWETKSPLDDSTCGCIVTENGKAYLMGSRIGRGMALRCGPNAAETIWQKPLRSGIDTPLLLGNQLYWHSTGRFFSADTETGDYVYRERLKLKGQAASFPNVDYSSPVAAGDNIIIFMRNGESLVIKAGREFQLVSHNPSFANDDSAFSSTPAISDGELFIRSNKYLYAIAKTE